MRNLGVVVVVGLALVIANSFGAGPHRDASASSHEGRYDSEEVRFLHLINRYREEHGVGPLLLSDTISLASERHSEDMARYSFFAHSTLWSSYYPAGSRAWDRMRSEGYDYNTLMGENIAVGCQSAQRCFELWRDSPAHNAAMLDGRYRVVGIGRLYVEGSVHGWYWTTDFGARVDPTSHAPDRSTRAREESLEDGPEIENGQMNGKAVWEQEARDGAELILRKEEEGYARLGDYDNGRDELRQRIRIGEGGELSYRIKIEATERPHPSDYLVVRLTDGQGDRLGVLKRYTGGDEGGWRVERLDLSRYGGRSVYLSFLVKTDRLLATAFYLDDVRLENRRKEGVGLGRITGFL